MRRPMPRFTQRWILDLPGDRAVMWTVVAIVALYAFGAFA